MNKAFLIGNLGQAPEVRSFQDGGRLAQFSVATSRKWKDRETGETQERTEWHRVVIKSDGLVSVCEKYLRKGSKVAIVGRIETRKWQDQAGADRWTTEIVVSGFDGQIELLGDPRGHGQPGDPGPSPDGVGGAAGDPGGMPDDDEIPF